MVRKGFNTIGGGRAWARVRALRRRATAARNFRTIVLLSVITVLSAFDLALTESQTVRGNFAEANALAAAFVNGAGAMTAYKVGLFGIGAAILYRLRRRWQSEAGLWVLLACHVALMAWWLVYIDVVEQCINDPAVVAPAMAF